MRALLVALLVTCFATTAVAAGPKVEIIVAEKAPALEKRAADEVTALLKRLYQAEATQLATPTSLLPAIFMGSPTTNPALEFAKADWPKLSDQGHIVKSTSHRQQPALIIGGGSPVATYWAACEYAHRLGVRTMLYGDLDPIEPPPFSLAGLERKCELPQVTRGWRLGGNSPISTVSWGRRDVQRLIGQLAKLKFSQVVVQVYADQPFIPLAEGIDKYRLWDTPPLAVSGDTAGRSAFQGAQFFENPDFAGKQTNEEQLAAGKAWLQSIIDAAHDHGLSVAVQIEPKRTGNEPVSQKLIDAQVIAYQHAYPQLDQIYSWSGKSYASLRVAQSGAQLDIDSLLATQMNLRTMIEEDQQRLPVGPKSASVILMLSGPHADVLPGVPLAASEERLGPLQRGYVATASSPADLDFVAYQLSRCTSGDKLTLAEVCDQLLTPVCGEEVHTRVTQALRLIDQATSSIEQSDPLPSLSGSGMTLKHYEAAQEPPASWGQVRESYLNAMNEMYRANTRAREGSRSYTLYLARRYEFGFEYMNCLQAVRNAGVAKKAGDKEKQIAELEKAIDSINGACNALAAVARSNSDRGLIAVMNADVYRPLVKELEKADQEP